MVTRALIEAALKIEEEKDRYSKRSKGLRELLKQLFEQSENKEVLSKAAIERVRQELISKLDKIIAECDSP